MKPARTFLALLLSLVMLLLTPAAGAATHNRWRIWDPQQFSIYNFAPCYWWYDAAPTEFKSRVSDGRVKWNAAGTEFYIWAGTCDKDIAIRYYDLPWPFDGAWAYVANDPFGNISYSTLNFNSCKNNPSGACTPWYTGTGSVPAGYVDALSNAVHEFGHTVELTHSTVCDPLCSVMYPTLNTGQQRRNLNAHDLASIRGWYPYPAQ